MLNLLFAMMYHKKIDLVSFQRIKMLVFTTTINDDKFIFDFDLPKDHYIQIGFKEVSIGQAPEHIFSTMT